MKILILCLSLLLTSQVWAELPDKKELDTKIVSDMMNKQFELKDMASKQLSAKDSDFGKKIFTTKQSSLLSGKEASGFGKELPLKMADFDREFKTSAFTGFQQENEFTKAQMRFDTAKAAPYSAKSLAPESEKVSRLDSKQYTGQEAQKIKQYLNDLQQDQYKKLAPGDTDLSLEQIREMLSKD